MPMQTHVNYSTLLFMYRPLMIMMINFIFFSKEQFLHMHTELCIRNRIQLCTVFR